jgi:hypothetical protein
VGCGQRLTGTAKEEFDKEKAPFIEYRKYMYISLILPIRHVITMLEISHEIVERLSILEYPIGGAGRAPSADR